MEFAEAVTVGQVMDQLGIPKAQPDLVLVNGDHAEESAHLEDGDVLSVFPPLAGGR